MVMMKSPYRRIMLTVLILWLAFGLRLYQIDFQSIWWDEGHSIFVASHPISQIPTLPAMDVHPPAYFVLLRLWMALTGSSEFAMRYLSTIFSLLTVALLWRFAQFVTSWFAKHSLIAPILASLMASLSPMYVAYGQEVRSYAMITFLALASTFMLWRHLFPRHSQDMEKKRLNLLLGYIVLTAACLYTHYFTVFLLLFQNGVWLVWLLLPTIRQPTAIGQRALWWLTSQVGILLLFVPQLTLALQQVTSYTNPNLVPPSLAYFISRSWQAYTVGLTIDPTPAKWGMWSIAAVILVSWLLLFLSKKRAIPPSTFSFLVLSFLLLVSWLVLPLIAYYIVLQRQPSFEPRYMILITPALFLLLTVGLSQMRRIKPPSPYPISHILLFALYTIPLTIFIIGLHSYFTNSTYFKDDSAGVANWLAAETTPNDIVYVDVPHPFHYYAKQRDIPAPIEYLFVDIHTAADILSHEAVGRDRLFWVTWWGSDTDPRGIIPFLAEKAGQPLGKKDFKGYKVEWFDLSKARQTSFSLPDVLTPTNITFGDVLRLDGVAFGGTENSTTTPISEPVWATLHFTLLKEAEVNYRVSLRLRGNDGQIVSQVDRDLLNDRHFRTSAWPLTNPALNQAINVYTLPLATDTIPGSYRLEVIVYNAAPPYPSEGITGHDNTDGVAAIIGRITIVP